MTAPEPRDEAPRWRWSLVGSGRYLKDPDGRARAYIGKSSFDDPEDRIVDTLNAGERMKASSAYEHSVELANERDALQERVTALELALRHIVAMPTPSLTGEPETDGERAAWASIREVVAVVQNYAARALAGTGEGATG